MNLEQETTTRASSVRSNTPSIPDFLTDPKYSDITLCCRDPSSGDGIYFKAHRMIVCPKSAVLAAQCEEKPNGARAADIKVEAHPAALACLLAFLYTEWYVDDGDAEVPAYELAEAEGARGEGQQQRLVPFQITIGTEDDLSPTNARLLVNAEVFALAMHFQIPSLATLAEVKFVQILEELSPSATRVSTNDDDPGEPEYEVDGFNKIVRKVYDITDSESPLRSALVRFAYHHREELCLDEEGVHLDYHTREFLHALHCEWIKKETKATHSKNRQIAELSNSLKVQTPRLQALETQISSVTAEKDRLTQQNIQLAASHTKLTSMHNTAKVILHGSSSTQCNVSVDMRKKRKRGQETSDTIIFQCSCGQSLTVGPQKEKISLFGGLW